MTDGVLLLKLHPEVATRSCDDCRAFMYGEGGKVEQVVEVTPKGDRQVNKKRPPGSPTPCDTHTGCPKGHHTDPKGFDAESYLFYRRYQRWKLTGRWPRDPTTLDVCAAVDTMERESEYLRNLHDTMLKAKGAAE